MVIWPNGIHRYRKKPFQIEIFKLTIFRLLIRYRRAATTKVLHPLDREIRLLVEPCELRKSRDTKIRGPRVFKTFLVEKYGMKDPNRIDLVYHEFQEIVRILFGFSLDYFSQFENPGFELDVLSLIPPKL